MSLIYHCSRVSFSFVLVCCRPQKAQFHAGLCQGTDCKCLGLCVSGSLVSGAVCVIVEEESPLLGNAGVQEVQQEDSGEGCGSTSVSAVL